ncbi:MAG: cell division protein ZapD [Sedimenticola sp.]|uniref:Cell division protein ZapD n=1 Tax=Sedimenticola thiotaurini TaxID=1543721 RepID=A0A558DC39_9GAMM|nr:cell division protein ZapD [Sedimenticola sp.]TVT58538.1 MAG: cell division protein ZapD [Sedimenticola thiotaurini]
MQPAASDKIIYEHPLNEKTRTFLRLEHLFRQVDFHIPQSSTWDSRAAISSLMDMVAIFSRADIKTDLIKELKRHQDKLDGIRANPEVHEERLNQILRELKGISTKLQQFSGQLGQELRENEFLKSITQRSSIPGGSCAFDLPLYHFWLQQPFEQRHKQIVTWRETLDTVHTAVMLLLSLIRGSTTPTRELASGGFFQQSLDPQSPAQLIRVGLPRESNLYAEISGGKHRFTIRFLEPSHMERAVQTKQDTTFFLNCCIL